VLPKPLKTSASRAQPRINITRLEPPDQTCSRENSREGGPSVLPSAVLAAPRHAAPDLAQPNPGMPHRIKLNVAISTLKESSRGSRSPQCCRLQRLPGFALTCLSEYCPANPCRTTSGFQRTQQRAPKGSVLRSISYSLTPPEHTRTSLNTTQPNSPSPVYLQ